MERYDPDRDWSDQHKQVVDVLAHSSDRYPWVLNDPQPVGMHIDLDALAELIIDQFLAEKV